MQQLRPWGLGRDMYFCVKRKKKKKEEDFILILCHHIIFTEQPGHVVVIVRQYIYTHCNFVFKVEGRSAFKWTPSSLTRAGRVWRVGVWAVITVPTGANAGCSWAGAAVGWARHTKAVPLLWLEGSRAARWWGQVDRNRWEKNKKFTPHHGAICFKEQFDDCTQQRNVAQTCQMKFTSVHVLTFLYHIKLTGINV